MVLGQAVLEGQAALLDQAVLVGQAALLDRAALVGHAALLGQAALVGPAALLPERDILYVFQSLLSFMSASVLYHYLIAVATKYGNEKLLLIDLNSIAFSPQFESRIEIERLLK